MRFNLHATYPFERLLTLLGIAVLGLSGCARVEPQSDFQEVGRNIKDIYGAIDVYDPALEEQIKERTAALLANGLTIDEAVSVALLNNPSFQSMFQSIGASRADVVQSSLLTNPSLVLGARFPEAGGRSEITLGFAQQLVDLWQIPVRKNIAEAELRQTILNVLNEAVRVVTLTKSLGYDVLWRDKLQTIAKTNLELATRSVELAQNRLKAGDADPLEAGLIRSQQFELQTELMRSEQALQNARFALAEILGLARWPDSWELVGSMEVQDHNLLSDSQIFEIATTRRFDVQMADARVLAAEKAIDLELLQVLPSLELGLQSERTERRALPGRKVFADTARASVAAGQLTAPTIESRGQRDLARRQIIDGLLGPSVALTLPLWDQNQAQIAKAHFIHIRLQKEREALLNTVVTEVRQATNDAKIALQQVRFLETEVIPQVEKNLNSARAQYESGAQNVLIFIETQADMFIQKRRVADASREYLNALATLERVAGGKLPKLNAATSQPAAPRHNRGQGQ